MNKLVKVETEEIYELRGFWYYDEFQDWDSISEKQKAEAKKILGEAIEKPISSVRIKDNTVVLKIQNKEIELAMRDFKVVAGFLSNVRREIENDNLHK